jgi:hypothetical protein
MSVPEMNKIPGVCYAWTDETFRELPGVELPVVDITHPAFALPTGEAEVSAMIDAFNAATQRLATLPPAVIQGMLQQSLLMRGMMVDSANTYTSGLMTYLNKLGPLNLGSWATPVDRQWAGGLTPLTFRWRMRDVARLLTEGLVDPLTARPGTPLHLINIGGGVAMDSLNALIVLMKDHPDLIAGRPITIHVLDLDAEGPAFGARALSALQGQGGPLHGLTAAFDCIPYDWCHPERLRTLVEGFEPGAVAGGSSEGGLFEFGYDECIIANLAALRDTAPAGFPMVGPVVRDSSTLDPRLVATQNVPNRPAIRYLGLERFGKLAAESGWKIAGHRDGPMHQVVRLVVNGR